MILRSAPTWPVCTDILVVVSMDAIVAIVALLREGRLRSLGYSVSDKVQGTYHKVPLCYQTSCYSVAVLPT